MITKEIFVHIEQISVGDTIKHNGQLLTISGRNLKWSDGIGRTIFGDSYELGTKKVCKIVFMTTKI